MAMQKEKVYMPRFLPAASVLGLLSLYLAGSNWLAGKPARAAGQQAPTPQRLQYAPLFSREDWTLASGLPNANTPREPEQPVLEGEVANTSVEGHLHACGVGAVDD